MSEKGRIHATLDQNTLAEVLALIEQLSAKLPFLVRLTAHEKQRLAKPSASSDAAANGVLALQVEAGIPLDPDDPMVADLSVARGLTEVGDAISDVAVRVRDTRFLAAAEAWSECLVRYGMLRLKARTNKQLAEQLKRIKPLITRRRARRSETPAGGGETPSETA